MRDFYSQKKRNSRITALLMLGFFAVVVSVGFSVDLYTYGGMEFRFPLATVIAASFAGIQGFVSYYYGDAVVLRSLGARPLVFENHAHRRLHNIVTEMALASGLPMPRIYTIPDPSPNAMAAGRGPGSSSVVVTEGLLSTLTREETQAVIAHEMGHIKSYDTLTMTVVAVLLGTVSVLSDWAVRSWRYGGIRPRRSVKGERGLHPLILLLVAFFVLLSPIVSRIIAMAVSRSREYQADALSAEFTRNPISLATALEKISSSASAMRKARRGTAHFFICDPLKRRLDEKEGVVADLLSTHPPVEKRVSRLMRMGYAMGAEKRGG